MLVEFSAYPKKIRNRAQRRLSYVSDDTADKILRHDRYWSVPFLALLVDACRERALDQPSSALALARRAPPLAELLRTGPGIDAYASAAEARSWRLVALITWAESARAAGLFDEAEEVLARAIGLAGKGRVDGRALAHLEQSRAALALERGDPEAGTFLDRALELGRRLDLDGVVAETLLLRAVAESAEGRSVGMGPAAEAVARTRPRGKRRIRLFDYCLALIRRWMVLPIATADDHRAAAGQLRQARRAYYTQTVKSERKMDLLRTEAVLLGRLGITRMGIRRLERIGMALEEIRYQGPLIDCVLELATFYLDEDSPERAREVLVEAGERLRRLDAEPSELERIERASAGLSHQALELERRRLEIERPRETVPIVLVPGRLDARLQALEEEWRVGGRRTVPEPGGE